MNGERLARSRAVWSIGVAGTLLATTAWGVFLYATNWETVYWNLGNNSHLYSYLHPALYIVAALVAGYVMAWGIRSVRSPGQSLGRLFVSAPLVLLVPTLWACMSTLLGRAYPA